MRKNKMLVAAALMLVLVMVTTCFVGGTLAKYTTGADGTVTARVANWGFEKADGVTIENLFAVSYDNVASNNDDKVIAPGTSGEVEFGIAYDDAAGDAPEVDYTFTVSTKGSECGDSIKANANIKWSLDGKEVGSWDALLKAIEALAGEADGSKDYAAGELPEGFDASAMHKISWTWEFSTGDAADKVDTDMGNMNALDEVTISIEVSATQIG